MTGRPVLAVVATPGSTERLRAVVRQLATHVDVRSLDRVDGRPDAVLAASIDALDATPVGLPVAVWVNDVGELERLGGARHVRVALSDDRMAIARGAVAVPPGALDTRSLPVLSPLIRARWRERHDLPADLVVTIDIGGDVDSGPDGDTLTALALAAVAVVSGPMLGAALALGTPVVSTAVDVDRLGLRAGREVEVAEADTVPERSALAQTIASDAEWAARLSTAARRFADRTLDVSRIADVVLDRLGLSATVSRRPRPIGLVDQRLAELATPPSASIRARAAVATACLAGPDDRS